MRRQLSLFIVLALIAAFELSRPDLIPARATQQSNISIRTEIYSRPPYSDATYYIYERDGQVICTKLEVCNKFDECHTQYRKGTFRDDEDIQTGQPYSKADAVFISAAKLRKHVCLTRFKLLSR